MDKPREEVQVAEEAGRGQVEQDLQSEGEETGQVEQDHQSEEEETGQVEQEDVEADSSEVEEEDEEGDEEAEEEDWEADWDLESSIESEPEPVHPIFNLLRQGDIAGVGELLTSDRTVLYELDSGDRHTPIHYPSWVMDESRALDMARLLLSHGAPVNSRGYEFYTPLHIACLRGREKVSDLLLTNGARYDLTSDNGHEVGFFGTVEVVKSLISHGAEVTTDLIFNCRDRDREAMLEVYLPTKKNTRGLSSPLLTDLLSNPAPLKKLCRDVLRRTMRTITGGRTIHPLVASLENSGELNKDCGDFLVCDHSGDWRKKMAANLVRIEVEKAEAVGIDLGYSYSCVGVVRDGKVEIIPNDLGQKITPSFISFREHPTRKWRLETLIGQAAKDEFIHNDWDRSNVCGLKSLLGRQHNDPAVQEYNKRHRIRAYEDYKTGGVHLLPESKIETDDSEGMGGYRSEQEWKPEELISLLVSKMKEMAETHLGALVKDAVFTVPANSTISQRLATREAGLLAGLNVIGILQEPVAAAIAYGLDRKEETTEVIILIFDLGNGTLDVSLLTSENNILKVKSTAAGKIREEEILNTVRKVLEPAKTEKASITDIVIAGGLTKFPVVQKMLQDFFPGSQLHTSINPEEVVATGAAIVASRLTAANTNLVSERDGGARSVQDSGAQIQDRVGDEITQQQQEDPSYSDVIDQSVSPPKKRQKHMD